MILPSRHILRMKSRMDGETASYIFFCNSIFSSAVRRMVRVSVCFLLNVFSFRTCFFAVASLIRFFWITFSFRKEKVSGSGNAAGLLPDYVREVRRRKAVDIHALCLPQPRAQSAGNNGRRKKRLRLYNLFFSSAYRIWLRLLVSTTISGTTRSHFQPIHIGAVIARIGVSVKFFNQVFFEQSLDCLVHGFFFPDSAPACDIFPGRESHIAFTVHTTTKKTIDGDVSRFQPVFKDSVVNHKEVFSFARHFALLSRCVFDIILQKYCVVNSCTQNNCICS